MPAILSCLVHIVRTAPAGGASYRLAELEDHILHDIGLRRTDLHALAALHAPRIKAARCRLRDVAFRLLASGRPASCC